MRFALRREMVRGFMLDAAICENHRSESDGTIVLSEVSQLSVNQQGPSETG
jgi:hypothetical protein